MIQLLRYSSAFFVLLLGSLSSILTVPASAVESEERAPSKLHLSQESKTTVNTKGLSAIASPPPLTENNLPTLTFNRGSVKDLAPLTKPNQIVQVQSGEPASVKEIPKEEAKRNPYFDRANTFYVTLYGIPLQGRASAQDFIGIATFKQGYGLGGAIGYRFDNNLRAELEYSYLDNGFQDLSFFIPGTTTVAPNQPEKSPGANVKGRAITVNAYYDFPVSEQFRPYIGAGIGTYNARINSLSPPGFGGFVANGDSPDRFAFQLRAGISYLFTPNFEVFTGYRYFKGNEFEYTIENSGTPPLVLRPNGLESNSLELGLRYGF